jgi:hypothetical protein
MKSKPMKALTIVAVVLFLTSGPSAFAQPPSLSASPTPTAQMQEMNQMPGMEKMSESMTKMSEMCMAMMQKEKAMMPLIIGVSAIFGLLLFVVLLLLVVLEIQWIKYWGRILKSTDELAG